MVVSISTEDRVIEIVASAYRRRVEEITLQTRFGDMENDPVYKELAIEKIEDELGIKIPDHEVVTIFTVDHLVIVVNQHLL